MKPLDAAILAGVLAAGFAAYKVFGIGKEIITKDLNPASSENIVNKAVTSAVSGLTGKDETLGGWLYDITHDDPVNSSKTSVMTDLMNYFRGTR